MAFLVRAPASRTGIPGSRPAPTSCGSMWTRGGYIYIYIYIYIIHIYFCRGFKSKFDSLTAETKPLLLIPKCHFRTTNEGMLSSFTESLRYYCINSSVLCIIDNVRERYSLSECDHLHLIQHLFFRSISYHNKH